MKRMLFGLSVFALFLGEVMWAAWHDDDGPLTQLAGGMVHDGNDLKSLENPLQGWSSENQTLDAILTSAVWSEQVPCAASECITPQSRENRPL